MSVWVDVARVSTALNVLLLGVLAVVWGRNWLRLRSKHTLGLLTFALLLLAENALAFYYYLLDPTLASWFSTQVPVIVWRLMLAVHVLETLAVAFLAWVTLD
jgi:hypothetical protein